jgi:formylglycine-generating enzyme required for sulfatase activity
VAVVNAGRTALVAGLSPSAAGILDLSGNLFEWQEGRWAAAPLAGVDFQGPASGSNRVSRGGGWSYAPRNARVAFRHDDAPGDRYISLGFRLLRTAS